MPDLGKAIYTVGVDQAPFDAGMAEMEATAAETTSKVGGKINASTAKATGGMTSMAKRGKEVSESAAKWVALPVIAMGAAALDLANKQEEAARQAHGVFGRWTKDVVAHAAQQGQYVNMTGAQWIGLQTQIGLAAKAAGLHGASMVQDTKDLAMEAGNMAIAYHTSTDSITSAIRSAASGRAMALKQYGILIDGTSEKEYALAHHIGVTSDYMKKLHLDQQKLTYDQTQYNDAVKKYGPHSQQATSALLTMKGAQQTLTAAQKGSGLTLTAQAKAQAVMGIVMEHAGQEAKRAAKMHHTLSFEFEHAKTEAEDLLVKLGQHLMPVFVQLVHVVAEVVGWLSKHHEAAKILIISLGILAGVILAVNIAFRAMLFIEKIQKLMAFFTGATEAQTAATEEQAAATEAATGAQAGLDAAMDANPVMLVVVAIIALVAIFVELYYHVHVVHEAVQKAFHYFMVGIDFVKDHWKVAVSLMIGIITGGVGTVVALVVSHFGQVKSFVTGIMTDVTGAVQSGINTVVGFFGNIWNRISSSVSNLATNVLNAFTSVFSNVGTTMYDGFKSGLNTLIGWLNSGINDVVDAEKMIPGSPNLHIPHNPIPTLAVGTNNFGGGVALVGEAGPELVRLPRGSAVANAGNTRAMLGGGRGAGRMTGRLVIDPDLMHGTIDAAVQDGIDRYDDWKNR